MLDFLNFLADRAHPESKMEFDFRTKLISNPYSLNSDNCKYLLNLQNYEKLFKLDSDMYINLLDFFGIDGLKIFANYAKRHFDKYSCNNKEHIEYISSEIAQSCKQKSNFEGWLLLYRLLNSEQWNSSVNKTLNINYILSFLLRLAIRKGEQSRNKTFEKRFDLLCKTLNFDNIDKDILRLLFLIDYNYSVDKLYESVCQTPRSMNTRIKYSAIALLINHPEEIVLDAISKEQGLMSMGILCYSGRVGIEISHEIRRYLKGLGSDNLMDIYATVDKKPSLPIEKFECQKEAKFIIDLISIHKNDRPLHFLLYGMEGTGKTELARTIAANTNCKLLDIGLSSIKKQIFNEEKDLENAIMKFRIRALSIAEIVFRNQSNLILLMDEADVLLNGFEKGLLNQMLEDMRLPVIWISNSLLFTKRSTMRRFNYSIEFKANNPSMRLRLWDNIVEKHNAQTLFPTERIRTLAEKYEVAPGGIELAVSNEILLAKAGKQEQVAELVLKQHSELLGFENSYKNTQSHAPRYDENVLNVQGMEKAVHAAKCYAQLLKNKDTESNCTMLLYGAPGTGKTEFAKYLARLTSLQFKEISYGKISSKYVGETEKNLARAFEDASEEGALLFIDEADSLISDRRNATRSWETTQVNEFLVQLENSKCLVICSTNFQGKLDSASNRRFHFHLKFDFLKKDGILKMAQNFFPELEQENWNELCRVECLAPGDFYAVYKRLQWLPKNELSVELVTKELSEITLAKEPYGNRRIGF
ncbi:MAG: ATP-binding protein [Fibromonadaceae bacterium]|jgi:SpoVK/Ycf46/Vps4 family AAA+-type ATPase|nr:ATP-binding protein [Fibromonadaceae bacterium]